MRWSWKIVSVNGHESIPTHGGTNILLGVYPHPIPQCSPPSRLATFTSIPPPNVHFHPISQCRLPSHIAVVPPIRSHTLNQQSHLAVCTSINFINDLPSSQWLMYRLLIFFEHRTRAHFACDNCTCRHVWDVFHSQIVQTTMPVLACFEETKFPDFALIYLCTKLTWKSLHTISSSQFIASGVKCANHGSND